MEKRVRFELFRKNDYVSKALPGWGYLQPFNTLIEALTWVDAKTKGAVRDRYLPESYVICEVQYTPVRVCDVEVTVQPIFKNPNE